VAKVKSIIDADQIRLYGTLDENLNGTNFNNTASQTIFSFGRFVITTNLEGRKYVDYKNTLSSFVHPVTLTSMGVDDIQAQLLHYNSTNAVLNLDKSDLNTFVRYGSAYEYLRIMIENIIVDYPGSLYANSQSVRGGNITFFGFTYDVVTNTSRFKIPVLYIVNTFGLVYNEGNTSLPNDEELRNLNISYNDYIIWSVQNSTGNSYTIIGFTGYSTNNPSAENYNNLIVQTTGNPFPFLSYTPNMSGSVNFHIKPNNLIFEEFRALLTDYQRYMLSARDSNFDGFSFIIKDPTLLDDGTIVYNDTQLLWATSDNYNIDTNTTNYRTFLDIVLTIGAKYDAIKTDLIARFLTPDSIKTYDLTDQGKMTKLLRIYGREFDQMREFIDSLVYINKVTYDKINNIPDQLVKNLARTFGWNYFSLVNENELVQSFLTINDTERNLNIDLMPAEIDIELWRRILINTNYFWKAKGTREAIRSIFLLIGIPDPFINITEYVYTVDGKINPNSVALTAVDFPSNSLPFNGSGYPIAPPETSTFYFQISGDTDSGQAYMNNFRLAGFNLIQTVDNKKSWVQAGATTRIDSTTPQYYQADSKLVLNTKEVDVALDTARGIEYDVYDYINTIDFPINSSGYTLPFSYVNISLGFTGTQNTFTLPYNVNTIEGDFEVHYNGILLNAPSTGATGTTAYQTDYTVTGNSFTIRNGNYAYNSGNRRDVIQATFIYSGGTHPVTGITVEYIVTRVNARFNGATIPLPSYPRGDVQVTINGIALTKGTGQFNADYILDPANSTGGSNNIIIQNPDVIAYLAVNPMVQIAYIYVAGSNDINARSEVYRIDSFTTGKVYYNGITGRYTYKLNYKANDASQIKVLIDGIALEPYTDYSINPQNLYEIFLPNGLHYGSVISVYYLIAKSSYFNPIISDIFGVGDISQLSFLEFIDLIERKMINVRNRKTITDFKGGWYPTLLNIYIQYLERATLDPSNPLLSNGYTFQNLYSFLSKYNSFFQRFVDELLPATIILKQSGLLIRNSIFTKQKFAYKRGVNLYSTGSTAIDMRGNPMLQYLGDDGSMFMIALSTLPPPPPEPALYVDTVSGTSVIGGIIHFGGKNINCSTGLNQITEYGIQYRRFSTDLWTILSQAGAPVVDNFDMSKNSGLLENTTYMYQAYIKSGIYIAYGQIFSGTTLATPIIPGLYTKLGIAGITTIASGGINITGGTCADWYSMQHQLISNPWITASLLPGPISGTSYNYIISGLSANTTYNYRSYMIVCGVDYCGNTYQTGTTLPFAVPTISIGNAYLSTNPTTSIRVSGNCITNCGCPTTISEYGIIYTQNPSRSGASVMCYENTPTCVCKKSLCNNAAMNPYFDDNIAYSIIGLSANSTTYYRAFAKNATGVGYDGTTIKCIKTVPIPEVVCLIRTYGTTNNTADSSTGGNITLTPALSTANQCVTVNYNIRHVVFGVGCGQDQTYIYCKKCGCPAYSIIASYITYSPSSGPPNRCVCQYAGSFIMCKGDAVCYYNHLSSTGINAGTYGTTCVDLCLTTTSSSSDITSSVSTSYCEDCTLIQ
jgi:hypothetical protein